MSKLSLLLKTAVVTGLLAGSVTQAEEAAKPTTDKPAVEAESCHHKEGKAADCKMSHGKKKMKKDKDSCGNGCKGMGMGKDSEAAPKADDKKAEEMKH